MNYIGSKFKLIDFIKSSIYETVGNDLSNIIFCDLFAGTGIVGRSFKSEVKQIISNDLEYYSYVLNKNYIENHKEIEQKEYYIDKLNNLTNREDGFIYKNYCIGSGSGRLYFSDFNGQKIDTIRVAIEEFKKNNLIDNSLYFFLLASLLESSDKVANTASVYGAFLKNLKKTAQKPMQFMPAIYELNQNKHIVYNEDSNQLIKKIQGDILYLDPPYNSRHYGSNYHILNTIAIYDKFEPIGKTGLRNYHKSHYCSKQMVLNSFEDLIKNSKFKYIFLSYNNEGLMKKEEIKNIMIQHGNYFLKTKEYSRFKADKDQNRNHKASSTKEYLHILIKD